MRRGERTDEDGAAGQRQPTRGPDRDAFGGFKLGAALFGWLVAVGLTILLSLLVGAIAGGIGAATGPPSSSAAGTAAIVSAVIALLVLALAYFAGGYVAGRMARFDGPKQGLGVWVIGVIVAVLLAVLGAVLGSQYDVAAQLGLPRVPLDPTAAGLGALISLLVVAVGTLLAAMAGGKAGTRYHRKVDRVGRGD